MALTEQRVAEPRRTRRRSAAVTAVGILLLVAGLGGLGWVAWQYLGTNVVAQRAFEQERAGLRERWTNPTGQPDQPAMTDRKEESERGQPTAALPGDAIALLRIPAFGGSYEVPVLAGTDLDILDRGVGHYPGSALPGQIGNFALAGHRVTHGEPFARLLELDRGEEVVVETRDAIYTYILDAAPRELTVPASATWVLDPVPGEAGVAPDRALLTLTTCQDLFRSPDRSVGFGHLARTQNKG